MVMEIKFNAVKAERKALVKAIGEILGMEVKYLGAPGFAFAVGSLIIDKNGTVDCGGQMSGSEAAALLAALAERGFIPTETPAFETEDTPIEYGDAAVENDTKSGNGDERIGVSIEIPEFRDETAGDSEAFIMNSVESPCTDISGALVIEWPDEGFDAAAFDNLIKLAAGKATLIRKALGQNLADDAGTLPILWENEKLRFPWFVSGIASEEIGAWSRFTGALCAAAKKQKRVTLKEKALDPGASEKFAFRCYLLKLGFIGAEYNLDSRTSSL
jgi:hypothetical protein